MARTRSTATSSAGDFDVITGPPAPPASQPQAIAPAPRAEPPALALPAPGAAAAPDRD